MTTTNLNKEFDKFVAEKEKEFEKEVRDFHKGSLQKMRFGGRLTMCMSVIFLSNLIRDFGPTRTYPYRYPKKIGRMFLPIMKSGPREKRLTAGVKNRGFNQIPA